MISGFLFNLSMVGQALSRQVGKGPDKLNSLANSPLPAKKLRSLLKELKTILNCKIKGVKM